MTTHSYTTLRKLLASLWLGLGASVALQAAAACPGRPVKLMIPFPPGGLIDEQALYESLKNGHLFGAGLDVSELEPPAPDYPLLAQQVIDVRQGKEPANRVA